MSHGGDSSGRFARGLTLGALVGAIIAGSSLWTKARARARSTEAAEAAKPGAGKLQASDTPRPTNALAAPAVPVADTAPALEAEKRPDPSP